MSLSAEIQTRQIVGRPLVEVLAPAPIGHNLPPKAKPLYRRDCPECAARFETETHDRLFCTDAHKAAFHNRSSKIGRRLVPLAMAWREGRNAKGKTPEALALRASAARAFSEMCRLIDAAAAEDRAEARPSKLAYCRRRSAGEGTLCREETAEFHAGKIAAAAKAAKVAS